MRYESTILAQLVELQTVCSHTAQLFLKELIPGAKDNTSQLFLSLRNHRQVYYEEQKLLPVRERLPYGMDDIMYCLEDHTVRDDEISAHVVEHDMLQHMRPDGENIYAWSLSSKANIRRHYQATKATLSEQDMLRYVQKVFASQLTTNELETIASIAPGKFPYIREYTTSWSSNR